MKKEIVLKVFSLLLFINFLNLGIFAKNASVGIFTTGLMLLFVLRNFLLHARSNFQFNIPYLLYGLIAIILLAIIRTNSPTTTFTFEGYKSINFLLLIVAFTQVIKIYKPSGAKMIEKLFVWILCVPLFLLVATNILGWVIGLSRASIGRENIGEAMLLSKLGFHIERVDFPFSPGYNSYAVIVGVLLLICLVGALKVKQYKKLFYCGISLSIITVLSIDTRAALIYPILIYLIARIMMKRNSYPPLLWALPLLMIFGTSLLLFVFPLLANINGLEFLSRSSEDLQTGNSRNLIWFASSLEFIQFKPIHLLGYGEWGHFESGASQNWAPLFGNFENAEMTTSHSTLYTILFDYGYLGLAVILALQYKLIAVIKRNWNKSRFMSVMLLSLLMYWNLSGISESFFGFYSPNVMSILFINFLFFFLIDVYRKEKKQQHDYVTENVVELV